MRPINKGESPYKKINEYSLVNKDELEKTMLEKAGLWLDEGYIFGTGGEGFERFNLAIPRSVLEDACQRLLKAFGK